MNNSILKDIFEEGEVPIRKLTGETVLNLYGLEKFEKYFDGMDDTLKYMTLKKVCKDPLITLEFIEKNLRHFSSPNHRDDIEWYKNPNVTIDFVVKHMPNIGDGISYISSNYKLKESDLKKYSNILFYWRGLCENPSFKMDFFERNIDKVYFCSLAKNPNITKKFIRKYWDKFKKVPNNFVKNPFTLQKKITMRTKYLMVLKRTALSTDIMRKIIDMT